MFSSTRLHEVRGFFLLMLNIFRELNSCEKQLNNRQHLYPVDVPRPRGLTSAQVTSNREKQGERGAAESSSWRKIWKCGDADLHEIRKLAFYPFSRHPV